MKTALRVARWGLWAALLAVVLVIPATAADLDGNYAVKGHGALSCQEWADERQHGAAFDGSLDPSGRMAPNGAEAWTLGYLTAFNAWVASAPDVSPDTGLDLLFAWVDSFCAREPGNILANAIGSLVVELAARPGCQDGSARTEPAGCPE